MNSKFDNREVKIPNYPVNSKIIWTAAATLVVNILVATGVLPEAMGPATIEVINSVLAAVIIYFRAFRTISPEALSFLKSFFHYGTQAD